MVVTEAPLNKLKPDPRQPRKKMDEEFLDNLAGSIAVHGQLQPVICFKAGESNVLVDGHCRVAALKRLNRSTVHAVVLDQRPTETKTLELQLTTNCLRRDLTPTEKARAYQRLKMAKGWSNTQLAHALSMSKASVTQTLSYLRLPEDIQGKLDSGELSGSTAYAIVRESDKQLRSDLLAQVRAGGLTRAEAERQRGSESVRSAMKRTVLRLDGASLTIAAGDRPDLAAVIELCNRAIKECKRASREGLDISTFERVLADRYRAVRQTEGAAS